MYRCACKSFLFSSKRRGRGGRPAWVHERKEEEAAPEHARRASLTEQDTSPPEELEVFITGREKSIVVRAEETKQNRVTSANGRANMQMGERRARAGSRAQAAGVRSRPRKWLTAELGLDMCE